MIKERRKGKRKEGNHGQIPFINIDTKVLNVIVANRIHQYKERLYIKWSLFQGCKSGSNLKISQDNQSHQQTKWKINYIL